jgi:cyanophycinase
MRQPSIARCAASLALSLVLAACSSAPAADVARGHLVIVGGGGTGPEIIARTLQLAGAANARVAVLPQASELPERGVDSAQMWRDAGAKEVTNVDFTDLAAARRAIEQADLIWFPGGDQVRLMGDLEKFGVVELVQRRFRDGATVGGTSAGAAVMSTPMITGEGEELLTRIASDSTKTASGLGLFAGAIVDQHFVRRQRANRLIGCVLDHPDHVGFGIDERTALVVSGAQLEVVGQGCVVVFDARRAKVEPLTPGQPSAATGLSMQVLRQGMTYEFRP